MVMAWPGRTKMHRVSVSRILEDPREAWEECEQGRGSSEQGQREGREEPWGRG